MATYTLQILHASDLEGGVEAIDSAPNFAAIVDTLEDTQENTIILSAGDNYIPGPFFNAAADASVLDEIQAAYEAIYGETGFTGLDTTSGAVDITIMNVIGFDASAVGNHEFDAGSATFAGLIAAATEGTTIDSIDWFGAQFPYLSSNLDFTTDANTAGLVADEILTTDAFQQTPAEIAAGETAPSLAAATIIEENGEKIGVVGATTQTVTVISSPGDITETTGASVDMDALAVEIQEQIDALSAQGVNKIVLVTHLQQIALEKELAGKLSGVDVIIAGGSDTLLADETDVLRAGDEAAEAYPVQTTDANGNPVLIVSTDGEYSYVGRLVVDFDENGVILTDSLDVNTSGAYATTDEVVVAVTGAASAEEARAASEKATLVEDLADAVGAVNAAADGQTYGETDVFLEGRRAYVRTEETNLGNLTADANLAAAQAVDGTVLVSLKNGGGIRSEIGTIETDAEGNVTGYDATEANPFADKEAGEISQLDIENALRFNNRLALVTLSPEDLKIVLEHAIAASSDDDSNQQGRYPQIGGMRFSYDVNGDAQEIATDDNGDYITDANGDLVFVQEGSRVQSIAIDTADGQIVLYENGELVADAPESVRIVTLNYLAGGGDGYPYPELGEDIVFLTDDGGVTADADAENLLGEQAAMAQYLEANYPVDGDTVFSLDDTVKGQDVRIQQLTQRSDNVVAPVESKAITLSATHVFDSGVGEGGSEIVAHENGLIYTTNGEADRIDIFNLADGSTVASIDLSGIEGFDGVQSVAVKNGVIAAAVSREGAANGVVALYDAETLEQLGVVEVGNLPDSLTFTPDGSKIVVANEGEPVDETTDPAGSISIIEVATQTVTTLGFADFEAAAARTFPGNTPETDWEPEYVAVSPDGTQAFVTIQEANAVAVVDLTTNEITSVFSAGTQDHSVVGLDASDKDDAINIQTYDNLVGNRMPDAIAAFEVDGATYTITANEGDDRGDFDEGGDAARVKDILAGDVEGVSIDESVDTTGLERLTVSIIDGDTDGDGDIDVLHSYGGRSVTIYDASGNIVWDSGEGLARIAAEFNTAEFNGNDGEFDGRSDNKGTEPEAVTVGVIKGRTYAFVGLERDSGIVVIDISNPVEPEFVQYLNSSSDGHVSPEGLAFVSAEDSPNGDPMLVASYEVSGTTVAYTIDADQLGRLKPNVDGTPVQGSEFDDILNGSRFADVTNLGAGDDTFRGGAGNDQAAGGEGDDILNMGAGADIATGGADDDKIAGRAGKDELSGGEGNDSIGGGNDADTIWGGLGDDVIAGNAAADVLYGNEGSDRIGGGIGADRIIGGEGDDRMAGGRGQDTFVFAGDSGDDVIMDFQNGIDMIEIDLAGDQVSFADLTIVEQGAHVRVEFGENSILLANTDINKIDEDDFLLS
ncbi:MAG: choice-of-anchor I family protein [Neomegalonema sp.]|nr:choice-of-anchor I family protein [Neomegalonema sp.]